MVRDRMVRMNDETNLGDHYNHKATFRYLAGLQRLIILQNLHN